jgi:hypothetical protein
MGVVVAYYGGRVLSSAVVVAVFWTSDVDIDLQQQIGNFYAAIAGSSYVDWLEEYDTIGRTGAGGYPGSGQHIGRGRFAAGITITPSNQSTMLSDGDIASELAAQIAAGSLPAPTLDAAGNVTTAYMVEIPPGYTVTFLGGTSCTDFCAYHSTVAIAGKGVPYAVLPDSHACVGTVCGQGFDDETILRSHELAEAITDTESGLVAAARRARSGISASTALSGTTRRWRATGCRSSGRTSRGRASWGSPSAPREGRPPDPRPSSTPRSSR